MRSLLLLTLLLAGCSESISLVSGPAPVKERPPVNLPRSLREWNWVNAAGSGSCVHASTVMHLRWQNQIALAAWWRKSHAGGESEDSIRQYLTAAHVQYFYTRTADASFLEWASNSRRGAIIWFYPRHCVHFCGYGRNSKGQPVAFLCDNNRIDRFIEVEKNQFLREWASYGGFALMTVGRAATANAPAHTFGPAPPPLVPALVRRGE